MKKTNISKCAVFIFAGLIVFAAAMLYLFQKTHQPIITKTSVEIQAKGVHPANNRQYQSSVWLGVFNGKLYFYPHCGTRLHKSSYDGFLCVFENGGVTKLTDLEEDKNSVIVQGFLSPFLYYWDNNTSLDKQSDFLYSYDLQSREEKLLYSGEANLTHNIFLSGDGRSYFPLWAENNEIPQFVCVKEGAFSSVIPLTEGYLINGKTYYAVAEYSDTVERLLCLDADGFLNEVPLGYAHQRTIIPCENGLLVHNESGPNILYWINDDGKVQELFSVECLDSKSAVNIHGTDVYLSFKRYKEYGESGMRRFENDTLEGTYRISLVDFTTQKISDTIYDGLYNFDDACLYACDEDCSIFQLDFDGNIIRTLFSRSGQENGPPIDD